MRRARKQKAIGIRRFLRGPGMAWFALTMLLMLSGCADSEAAGTAATALVEKVPVESVVVQEAQETPSLQETAVADQTQKVQETPKSTAKAAEEAPAATTQSAAPAASQAEPAEEASAQTPAQAQAPASQAPAEEVPTTPEPAPSASLGRILFVGDSRTVDLFSQPDSSVSGLKQGDITVYAANGRRFDFLNDTVVSVGLDNFDTLVSWMGANDRGDFSPYGPFYEQVLMAGKTLILCSVGPSADDSLQAHDIPYYYNSNMVGYNNAMTAWAAAHGVRVIDLYSYVANNVEIDANDGIHYLPQPNPTLWSYIVSQIGA